MPFTSSREQQADKPVRTAAPPAQPGVPPWGLVLATTVRLWGARRLHRLRRSRRAWLVATCVLVVGVLGTVTVIVGVQLTGTSSGPATRVPASGRTGQGTSPRSGSARSTAAAGAQATAAGAPAAAAGAQAAAAGAQAAASGAQAAAVRAQAAVVRAQAAAWIAGQVGGGETIACDPSMCTALSAHGVASSRLLSLPPSASGARGADIVVASPSAHAWLSTDAPALLASVGSGAQLIEVRAASPGGTTAYQAALRSDLADRRSAGAQLMHSRRIEVGAQEAGQFATGEVDSRLLVMLAVLASQRSWRVIAFGDASPGVPLTAAPYRQVTIAGDGGGTAGLAAALAVLRAQHGAYQPAQVTTVRLAGGQPALRIDFAAPSPLGLLAGSTHG